jgi:RNA polymerase sigma factor (TIGR02999 family)
MERPTESPARPSSEELPAPDGMILFEELYAELRRLAAGYMRSQSSTHTLQTTALIGEAYLKIAQADTEGYSSRAHFMATAARAMRSVLVDHARAKSSSKRHADGPRIHLDGIVLSLEERSAHILDLDNAMNQLERLGDVGSRGVRIVELRFFSGLSMPEIADALEMKLRRVERDWEFARAYLSNKLR